MNDFLDFDNLDLSGFNPEAFNLDRPATAQGLIAPPSFDVEDYSYRPAAGGVQRTPRPRPSSGVFGYSANHPLALQSQIQQQSLVYTSSQDCASNASSPETVGSGTGSAGASFAPSASLSPYNSPPTGFAPPRTLSPGMFNSPNLSTTSRASSRERKPSIELGVALDPDVTNALIQLVLSHRPQAGLAFHPARMLARVQSLHDGSSNVLRSATLLFGAFLARGTGIVPPEAEKTLETRVAEEIISCIRSASAMARGELEMGDGGADLVDAVQAAVMFVRYLYASQRPAEARVHLASAAELAIQLGLHQLGSLENTVNRFNGHSSFRVASAQDSITLGSRVRLFWELFILDRVLSVELGLAPLITDDDCVETRIDTPWPEEIEEYEASIPLESIRGSATLRTFFWQQGMSGGGFSQRALLAKAVAVYSACARTSLHWGMRSPATPPSASLIASSAPVPANSPQPDANSSAGSNVSNNDSDGKSASACFSSLETTLARLGSALLPTHQLSAALPDVERRHQIALHTLLHTAAIQLHIRLAQAGVRESLEKCVRAARAGAALVRCLNESDVRYLDFWIGVSLFLIRTHATHDAIALRMVTLITLPTGLLVDVVQRLQHRAGASECRRPWFTRILDVGRPWRSSWSNGSSQFALLGFKLRLRHDLVNSIYTQGSFTLSIATTSPALGLGSWLYQLFWIF